MYSNISEGEALEIVDSLKRFTDKEKRLSKYADCKAENKVVEYLGEY